MIASLTKYVFGTLMLAFGACLALFLILSIPPSALTIVIGLLLGIAVMYVFGKTGGGGNRTTVVCSQGIGDALLTQQAMFLDAQQRQNRDNLLANRAAMREVLAALAPSQENYPAIQGQSDPQLDNQLEELKTVAALPPKSVPNTDYANHTYVDRKAGTYWLFEEQDNGVLFAIPGQVQGWSDHDCIAHYAKFGPPPSGREIVMVRPAKKRQTENPRIDAATETVRGYNQTRIYMQKAGHFWFVFAQRGQTNQYLYATTRAMGWGDSEAEAAAALYGPPPENIELVIPPELEGSGSEIERLQEADRLMAVRLKQMLRDQEAQRRESPQSSDSYRIS